MNFIHWLCNARNLFLALILWLPVQSCLCAGPTLSNAAPEENYQQAYNLYEGGNFLGAVEKCKAVLAVQPDHWRAMQVAGYASFQLKDTSSAIGYCRRSLIFHPDNPALQEFLDKISQNGVPFPPVEPAQVPPPPWANMVPSSFPVLPAAGPGPGTASSSSVHFGFEAGANYSNITYDQSLYGQGLDLVGQYGFAGGLAFRVDISSVFSIQPELLYTQKGFSESEVYYDYYGSVLYSSRVTIKLDYLEMPVLLKLSIPSRTFRPNIFAGISAGVYVGGTLTDSASGISVPYPSYYLNNFESSLILGLGLDIGRFSISGRFEQGLTSIYPDYYPGDQIQNQLFNLMVGFFPI